MLPRVTISPLTAYSASRIFWGTCRIINLKFWPPEWSMSFSFKRQHKTVFKKRSQQLQIHFRVGFASAYLNWSLVDFLWFWLNLCFLNLNSKLMPHHLLMMASDFVMITHNDITMIVANLLFCFACLPCTSLLLVSPFHSWFGKVTESNVRPLSLHVPMEHVLPSWFLHKCWQTL